MNAIEGLELGVIGEDVVATFAEEGTDTKEAMTIDQIRTELLNIAIDKNLEAKDAYLLRVASHVLSELEAEYINCFAEPE